MKRRLRTLVIPVLSVVIGLLGALIVAEIAVRLVLPPRPVMTFLSPQTGEPTGTSPELSSWQDPSHGGMTYDTPTGRRLRPGLRIRVDRNPLSGNSIELRTNALGFRGPEIHPIKTEPRVLFLGDSITLSDYLNEDETFVVQTARELKRRRRPMETINAGVGSIALQDEIALLHEKGLSVRPDWVVLDFYLNDFRPSPAAKLSRLPSWLDRSELAYAFFRSLAQFRFTVTERLLYGMSVMEFKKWQAEIVDRFPPGPGDPRKDRAAFYRLVQEAANDWGSAWSPKAWEQFAVQFRNLRDTLKAKGIRLLVVAFPVRAQVEAEFVESFPQEQLAALSKSLGFPMLDLLPKLRSLEHGRESKRFPMFPIFYDHCHHTPEASRAIATWIAEAILTRSWPTITVSSK